MLCSLIGHVVKLRQKIPISIFVIACKYALKGVIKNNLMFPHQARYWSSEPTDLYITQLKLKCKFNIMS